MKNAAKFEPMLKKHLEDSDQAAEYLTACYEEGRRSSCEACATWWRRMGG
jgi:hypothetical protein